MPYEAPKGQRVNVLGALRWGEQDRQLLYELRTTSWDSLAFLSFIWHKIAGVATELGQLPPDFKRAKRRVVVLDNYAVHKSNLVRQYEPVLKAVGVTFFYLPPYSPELNPIEGEWRQLKYQDLPKRSYAPLPELVGAVETALQKRAA